MSEQSEREVVEVRLSQELAPRKTDRKRAKPASPLSRTKLKSRVRAWGFSLLCGKSRAGLPLSVEPHHAGE
jgi:hypothetical protein